MRQDKAVLLNSNEKTFQDESSENFDSKVYICCNLLSYSPILCVYNLIFLNHIFTGVARAVEQQQEDCHHSEAAGGTVTSQ